MKRLFKILAVVLFVVFAFAGCSYEVGVDMEVIYIDAKRNNWQISGKEGEEGTGIAKVTWNHDDQNRKTGVTFEFTDKTAEAKP